MAEPVFEASDFFIVYPGNTIPLAHHKCIIIRTDASLDKLSPNITHVWCYENCKLSFLSENVTYLFIGKKYTLPLCDNILAATSLKTLVVENEALLANISLPPTLTKLYGKIRDIELDIAKFTKPKNLKMINRAGVLFDIPGKKYELLCINTTPFPVTETAVFEGKILYKQCSLNGDFSNEYSITGLHTIEDIIDENDRSKVMGWMRDDGILIKSLNYESTTRYQFKLDEPHDHSKINVRVDDKHTFLLNCENGHIEAALRLSRLSEFMAYGELDINALDAAFQSSCKNGHIETLRALLQLGESRDTKINIHAYNERAFISSCENGHIEIARLLIQLGETGGYGHIEIARWLIQLGETPSCYCKINIHASGEHAFLSSCENGHIEIVRLLIQLGETGGYGRINIHANDETAFILSCENGHIEIARLLVQYEKINIHANNEAAFILSCENGHIEMVRWLIQLGESTACGRINIRANNEAAFILSCENGHIEIARLLVQLGETKSYGKINIHANNEAAFILSCENGHIEMARLLVQFGETGGYGKIDIRANNEAALLLSSRNGHVEIVRWLIQLSETGGFGNNECTVKLSCENGRICLTEV